VLITGGLAGLGRLFADHLADQGWALRLGSRRGEADADWLAALRARTDVEVVRLDVCDPDDAARATRGIRGVVHAAGILDDALLPDLSPDALARVLAPKLDGTANLDAATAELDLAFFVGFSSTAGVVGAPGQANHAAANQVLDALLRRRRARGLPAQSLAWSVWTETGAATGARVVPGLEGLRDVDGLALFDQALAHPDADLLLARVQPRALVGVRSPLWSELVPEAAPSETLSLAGLDDAAAEQTLRAFLAREAARTLGLPDADAVDADRALTELGLDSLMALQLRNRLTEVLHLRLPPTLLFDAPTLDALVAHLLPRVSRDAPAPVAPPVRTVPAPATTPVASGATEHQAALDGLVTAWLRWDDAPVRALCVHGMREHAGAWAAVAARVPGLAAMDLPGHGLSARLPGVGPYDLPAMARQIRRAADALEVDVLVAHSLGAQLALALVAADPMRWRGLVLLDPPLTTRAPASALQTGLRAVLEAAPPDHRVFDGVAPAAALLAATIPADVTGLAERAVASVTGGVVWRWDPRLHLPLLGQDVLGAPARQLALLHAAERPVLAVFGARSAYTHAACAQLVREQLPGARVLEHDTDHWPHLEAADEVAADLAGFLATLEAR
jgi:pimeloyl-ACP methyl ester carboxylesterase/acyl carrier protein